MKSVLKMAWDDNMETETDKPLLQNDLGEVRHCDCGGVNLVMGPVTLHFAREEVPALAELTQAALALVQQHKRQRRRRAKAHLH